MITDIIVIVWNQFKATKACLESIISKTKAPFRILLIDNASGEKTSDFLKIFSSQHKDKVKLIRNESNLGFVKAANQGLDASSADFVCFLNNDTLVTEGWLGELMFVAVNNPLIGLLNPSSNTLGQKIPLRDMDNAAHFLKRYHGRFEEMAQTSGFCMLVKRQVIEKIGRFDEAYGMGNFEDTDYCRRAVRAGFICARAAASYVYHKEGVSFLKLVGSDASFRKNQALFYSRWGKPKRIFIEARRGLLPKQAEKIKSLARAGHWVFVAKEKNVESLLFKHSNIKTFSFRKPVFEIICLFRILKKLKKRYDYLLIQSSFLRAILVFLSIFHRARVLSLGRIGGLEEHGR